MSTGGNVTGGAEEPPGKDDLGSDAAGFLSQRKEDSLADILRQVGMAQLAHGRTIDEVQMPAHQLSESLLGVLFDPGAEKFRIIHTRFISQANPRRLEKVTIKEIAATAQGESASLKNRLETQRLNIQAL